MIGFGEKLSQSLKRLIKNRLFQILCLDVVPTVLDWIIPGAGTCVTLVIIFS